MASGSTILQDLPKITVEEHVVNRALVQEHNRKLFLETYTEVSNVTCLKLVHGKEGTVHV